MTQRLALVIACAAAAGAASAHHGIANYDLNKDLALEGVVTGVELVNPHSWLYLDVTNPDGTRTAWRCEMRGRTVLLRSGWSEDLFPAGLKLSITGSPDRRDPTTCYFGTAFFPDGRSIDRYGQLIEPERPAVTDRPARTPSGAPNLAGDWAAEQRVMTDPRGQRGTLVPISVADRFEPGQVPEGAQAFPGARGTEISLADDPVDAYWNQRPSALPLTEVGARTIEGLDLSSADNPRLRCAPTNILFDWTFETDINRITQTADEIRMLYGSMGIERTIHLNRTEHAAELEPSVAGHSIGRWEGDALVVDTEGFAPGILSADGRLPHGAGLHIVERFTFDPERLALARSYVAEDPEYFVGSYTGTDTVYLSDLPYHGTTPCEDSTASDTEAAGAAAPDGAATAAHEAPWWMFWKFWD